MVKYTPSGNIIKLDDNEIFVAGTNQLGAHGAGAAATAHKWFGLEWGVGEGLSGQTYALPTMEGLLNLEKAAQRFIRFAKDNPELTFYLTKVGTGIAGHPESTVKRFFADCPDNVIKPEEW